MARLSPETTRIRGSRPGATAAASCSSRSPHPSPTT